MVQESSLTYCLKHILLKLKTIGALQQAFAFCFFIGEINLNYRAR